MMKNESRFSGSQDDEDDEDETSWQDSYSDLMTDLLAIFVVLFSFAMMSQAIAASEKKQAVAPEIDIISHYDEVHTSIYDSIKAYIDEEGLSGQLSVTEQGDNMMLLRVESSIFFDSGRANIKTASEPILDSIAQIMKEYSLYIKMVRIEGHTDNRPMHDKQFDSNWELSTTRAVNVLRRFVEVSRLNAVKFSAVGYGEYHPIADNAVEDGKSKNRRVDFIIETVGE